MGTRADPGTALLTLHVRLLDARPPVWRRLEVAGGHSVDVFVEILQAAMGWRNLHRHEIVTLPPDRRRRGRASTGRAGARGLADGGPGPVDEWAVTVADLLGREGDRIGYRYDLVHRWEHEVETLAVGPPPEGHAGAAVLDGRGPCPADAEPGSDDPGRTVPFHVAEADAAVRAAVRLPHGRTDIARDEADVMAWFVDWVGDGTALEKSGRLPEEAVAAVLGARGWTGPGHTAAAHRTGSTPEDLAYPVLVLDSRARALGLVEVHDGVLRASGLGRDLAADRERLAGRIAEAYPRSVLWGSAPRGWSARG